MDTRDEIRTRYPNLAARSDAGSRLAGIRLHCIECMGGAAHDAIRCESTGCPLWRHRGHSWTPEGRAEQAARDAARRALNAGTEAPEASKTSP